MGGLTGFYSLSSKRNSVETSPSNRQTRSLSSLFTGKNNYANTLEKRLNHVIQQHRQADVPVGALLNGISSSLVVALMAAHLFTGLGSSSMVHTKHPNAADFSGLVTQDSHYMSSIKKLSSNISMKRLACGVKNLPRRAIKP
ncbi:asparagine synthase-related protein [Thiothrix fructosivorans]|uniref:Asparagine synthetase domain-containing protein n=1 Tax=Thiothrix fructosivorans TaxID=111770 RepID=A0A8B0SFS2_9GAMM|nr:asparagine synthase-related protein [Thiothrix fructosivorans]MBO0614803.1 hypothetical protein [Thiothrix fructosivorans]QTX09619.1 hypothetical protein J1836_013435 [Thiothrix fructosivorans]